MQYYNYYRYSYRYLYRYLYYKQDELGGEGGTLWTVEEKEFRASNSLAAMLGRYDDMASTTVH